MEYRYLGRSGLKVSVMTMGTMTFATGAGVKGVGAVGLAEAREQIDLCLDAGVNLIDTANIYSQGESETIIGEALGGKRPNDVLIASKVRFRMDEGPNGEGLSRHHVMRQVEGSLKRLRTDVIDILYLHEWDGMTPLEETFGALDTLVAAGEGPLRRGLELFRLAPDEGAGDRRGARVPAAGDPADPLYARGAGGGVRAGADRGGRGGGDPRLEPAGGRAPVAASTGRTRRRRGSSAGGTSRRSATWSGCGGSWRC